MKQSDFPDLPQLNSYYRYENFLNIYEDDNKTRFYNLLRNINIFPAQDSSIEDEYIIKPNDTWYSISYNYYSTMDLWWIICEYNQIKNAIKMPEHGTKIKILKSEYVWPVIINLNNQINS
jgi:hypothetical protein